MKRILSIAAAICFTVATFAQGANTNTQAKPAPMQGKPEHRTEATHHESTPVDKAKQYTDEINRAVSLDKATYDKVMKVNVDFQTKKAAICGGKKMKELSADQQTQVKQLKATRKTQLEAAMGKDMWAKWEASKKGGDHKGGEHKGGKDPQPKGAKPASDTESEDEK